MAKYGTPTALEQDFALESKPDGSFPGSPSRSLISLAIALHVNSLLLCSHGLNRMYL
jgi:hypothetical protein